MSFYEAFNDESDDDHFGGGEEDELIQKWQDAFGEKKRRYVSAVMKILTKDELEALKNDLSETPFEKRGGMFVKRLKSMIWSERDYFYPPSWESMTDYCKTRWSRITDRPRTVFDVIYITSGECDKQRLRNREQSKKNCRRKCKLKQKYDST